MIDIHFVIATQNIILPFCWVGRFEKMRLNFCSGKTLKGNFNRIFAKKLPNDF